MSNSKQSLAEAISNPYTLTTSATPSTLLTLRDLKLTYNQLASNVSASVQPTYLTSPYQTIISLSNIHLSGIRQFITPAQSEPESEPPTVPSIDTWEQDLAKLMEVLRS